MVAKECDAIACQRCSPRTAANCDERCRCQPKGISPRIPQRGLRKRCWLRLWIVLRLWMSGVFQLDMRISPCTLAAVSLFNGRFFVSYVVENKRPWPALPSGTASITSKKNSEGNDFSARLEPEFRRASTDLVGDVARRQMAVMRLDHARGGMAKVLRHHHQRHAGHHRERGPRVAQGVEIDRRLDSRALAGRAHP